MTADGGAKAAGLGRDTLLLVLLGLALYGATLAPTVLWGDSAHLQLSAVQRNLHGSAGSHPLWVWIAHQFTRIPVGGLAGRVNLVSAVFGAVTLGVLYLILREVGLGRGPAILATLAFLVSHTFWSHAVQAEVYTLTLALMALLVWSGLRWYHSGERGYLLAAGMALGLGLTAHLIVVLYVPALLWLAWRGRRRLDVPGIGAFSLALVLGVSPLLGLLIRDARVLDLGGWEVIRWALFSFEGYDFGGAFFDFSLRLFPADLFEWLAFLGMQFVGLAGICGVVGMVEIWRAGRDVALFVLLLYLGALVFAFAYRVGDRYVFYLPSYLPFVAWIGFGLQRVEKWLGVRHSNIDLLRRRWFHLVVGVVIVGVPVMAYRAAPELVDRGITFRDSRHVPGEGGKYYFLWPPKVGYDDARTFAEETLTALPRGTVLLADPILAEPLFFVQAVEAIRPDVTVRYCCWDIARTLEEAGERPVALADVASEIYPIERLRDEYEMEACGPVYLLAGRR